MGQQRAAHEKEARHEAGAPGQGTFGGKVRLLHDLGVDLGEDAGVGDRQGQHAGRRRGAGDLQQQHRPEEFVNRAHAGGDDPRAARPREDQRQRQSETGAEADAHHGEGDRQHHLAQRDGGEVRVQEAGAEAGEVAPGMERLDP